MEQEAFLRSPLLIRNEGRINEEKSAMYERKAEAKQPSREKRGSAAAEEVTWNDVKKLSLGRVYTLR